LSRGFGILEISQDCSSGWMNRLTKASIVLAGLPVSWYNSTINVLSSGVNCCPTMVADSRVKRSLTTLMHTRILVHVVFLTKSIPKGLQYTQAL
jgi:hypothetical protein